MTISLSKICGFAGLRVGAAIAHPPLMTISLFSRCISCSRRRR